MARISEEFYTFLKAQDNGTRDKDWVLAVADFFVASNAIAGVWHHYLPCLCQDNGPTCVLDLVGLSFDDLPNLEGANAVQKAWMRRAIAAANKQYGLPRRTKLIACVRIL